MSMSVISFTVYVSGTETLELDSPDYGEFTESHRSLKIIVFPVHRPGELISAKWVLFSFFFSHFRDFSTSPPPPAFSKLFLHREKKMVKKKI